MKKIYLIIFIASMFQMRSQSWCTLGSTWHYSIPSPNTGYVKYTYLYDTLVGLHVCNKIKYEAHGSNMSGPFNHYSYIYTFEQNGVVFKNNGTLISPVYDTLYNFNGTIGTKWRCQLTSVFGGPSCAQSYIEITDAGTTIIQGQTLNWRRVLYKNYYFYGQAQQYMQSGTDTLFERIGTRHNMEFITGFYCGDVTDIGPSAFRCFSDNQINLQMTQLACNYVTSVNDVLPNAIQLELNNPASDIVHIKIKGQESGNKRILVTDQFGKKVAEYFLTENEIDISTQHITNGMYLLQCYIGTQFTTRKLVIQK